MPDYAGIRPKLGRTSAVAAAGGKGADGELVCGFLYRMRRRGIGGL